MQKKQSYFIWLVWAKASLLCKSRARFCATVLFLGMCKVLKDLDKTLVHIQFLQHIHHENLPISSVFNARRK